MGRSPCCSKEGLNRGAWSAGEDKILSDHIEVHGEGRWRSLPKRAGLKRCGKSCRLRWMNYLRPGIKRGNISDEEEELIIRLHRLLGNRWSLIAGRLPGRTDNEIKNYWNTNLGKKVKGQSAQNDSIKHVHKMRNIKQVDKASEAKTGSTRVIPTKAFRCTKLFITPKEPIMENQNQNSATETGKLVNTTQEGMGSEPSEVPLSTPQEEGSSNSLMDFDVGELSLSDLLDCSFFELCDGILGDHENAIGGDGNINKSSQSFVQSFEFNEGMLEDWLVGNGVQPGIDSDLKPLASSLDSEKDGLVQ